MLDLLNSTALVTGASQGLGKAFARALAKRGSNLVLVARSRDALQELAELLSAQHRVKCLVLEADLAALGVADRIAGVLDDHRTRVDLLVNNAGLGLPGAFLDHDVRHELASIQVNVGALVSLCHVLGKRMVARGSGGIINLSSNAAFLPLPGLATYAATKAFVQHFTEALRFELKESGVHVMAAVPGPTATNFFQGVSVQMHAHEFDDAAHVADRTLEAFLRGETVAYPGRLKVRVGTWLPRLGPRDLIVKFAAAETSRMGLTAKPG
jgi:short-subunit dehydrogenase